MISYDAFPHQLDSFVVLGCEYGQRGQQPVIVYLPTAVCDCSFELVRHTLTSDFHLLPNMNKALA